jgi:N6-adenosine-specific RNA methylase IME4
MDATDRALVPLNRARKALAEAKSLHEVKAVRDQGHAALAWAKQQRDIGLDARNDAAEIVLLAERMLGAGLDKIPRAQGRRTSPRNATLRSFEEVCEELGYNKMQASRFQAEARVPEETFLAWLAEIREAGKELTSGALIRLGRQQPTRQPHRRRSASIEGTTDNLATLIAEGKRFACVYADPPWEYGNRATRASADKHYATMSVEEVCAEPVADLAADNAHLHLWTTNAFLFEARRVMEAWGFEYKSCLVWVKPQMGIGNYWRVSHEFLLFGLRGRLPFADRGQMSWIQADRTKHSRKPREVREAVEKVSPGPYLELYGREPIDGWTVYGNQIEATLFS